MLTLILVLLFTALLLTRALTFLATLLTSTDHNPYRYGCRRHHTILGAILPVVALVTLDRLLDPRR